MNIGNSIKRLRKQKGMNQSEFGNKCGLSQTALSQIETGFARPNKKTLEKICNILEVPEVLLYLLSMDEEDVPDEKKQQYKLTYPLIKELAINLFYEDKNKVIV
ncbi:MAG TPA: helix-turn-helix transcriptional regulator [Vicingus sp.]|nr:helix-turn-helix transcriptional regulator [Vicingus sp.]HRP58951.1 helix-turn-helix transcriptional regulator [Vicingus sp.]